MKFRDTWLNTACKFVFPGGQMRAMYMSASPPVQSDLQAETSRLINLGYPADLITKSAAVAAMKWRVVLTPEGLFAMREDRVEHIAPGIARGLSTLSALFDTSRRKTPLPVYAHKTRPAYVLERLNARVDVGYLADGATLSQTDVARVLECFFGDVNSGSHNVVTPLGSKVVVRGTLFPTPQTLVGYFPVVGGQTALVVPTTTNIYNSTYGTEERDVYAAVYVPEIIPGLTHIVCEFSYLSSDIVQAPADNPFVFGIVAVGGSPWANAVVRRHLTRREVLYKDTSAATFFEDAQPGKPLTLVNTRPDPTVAQSELNPYVLNQFQGFPLKAGWVIGDCYFAAMPEFCDSFAIIGGVERSADGKVYTFARSVQIGATFPPSVLRAMRSSSAEATTTTPAVEQRVYSWMGPATKIPTGLLSRLRLKSLTDKAKVDLSKELFIDKPAADGQPAMKVTFGEVAKRAEGQNFVFCHYLETDAVDDLTHVIVTGTLSNLTVTGYAGTASVGPVDPDTVLAFISDGGVIINQTTAVGTPSVQPTLVQIVPLITGGGELADIEGQATDPTGDFNLRRRFYGTWPAWPSLSSTALAAVQTYCYALDQRGLHQLMATSISWSQLRESK